MTLLLSSAHMFAMQLTPNEQACFESFYENFDSQMHAYHALTEDEQAIFCSKSTSLQEAALHKYATEFYHATCQTNKPFEYCTPFLHKTLLKMRDIMDHHDITKPTNYITAYMYVFSELLQPNERSAFLKDIYVYNKLYSLSIFHKCGILLAQELIKINLISDTEIDKQQAAYEYYLKTTTAFKDRYGH